MSRAPTMMISTAADTIIVALFAEGSATIALNACSMGPCPVFGTPIMPAT